jgi:hypothetical protein
MASLLPKIAFSYSTTRGSCLKINSFNCMAFRRLIAIDQVARVSKFLLPTKIFAAENELNFSTSRTPPLYHRPASACCPKTVNHGLLRAAVPSP